MSRDKVEMHFDAPRVLANLFKQALAESEWSSQAEFFRFHMMELVGDRKLSVACAIRPRHIKEKKTA